MRALALLAYLAAAPAPALGAEEQAQDYPLPAPPQAGHLKFVADHFEYESSSAMIHLKGHVRIVESTPTASEIPGVNPALGMAAWNLKADEIWLDADRHTLRSEGFLMLEDGYSAVYGDRAEFDYKTHRGLLRNPAAGHGELSIHAKSVRIGDKGRLDYRGADFSGCIRYPNPHYHFHASHVTVVPQKYIAAYNTFFYIGRVPIFYTPVLFKSLRKKNFFRFKLQPGYDRRNGGFIKSTLLNSHGPHVYSKLYIDYYTSQGVGVGGELHHRTDGDSRGVLYGYHIGENEGSHRDRWSILGDKYQAVTSSVSFQGRLQIQSDSDFNNDYARSSVFRVTPELINSGAVVYRLPAVTARLSYSRTDSDLGTRTKFFKTTESSPRLDVQSAAQQWGRLPWLNTLTAFADNSYDRWRGYQQKSAGAGWEGTRTIALARGLSFTPLLRYEQAYFNRVDEATSFKSSSTILDTFIGRYTTEGTLRFATPVGDWDLTQLYVRRQKAGSMADDAGALDHGVESNLMSLEDAFRPSRQVLVRILTGYDFRKFRDRDVGFRRRVQPIVGEVVYNPRPSLNFTVRDDYQLEDRNRSFLFSGQWGESDGTFIGGGFSHNLASARSYFANSEFGWKYSAPPGKDEQGQEKSSPGSGGEPGSWRVAGALRSEITSGGGFNRVRSMRLFEKEISISKTFHDFYARAMGRFRSGGVKEFFFRIDMRLGSFHQVVKRDWEAEWFPERKNSLEDRP